MQYERIHVDNETSTCSVSDRLCLANGAGGGRMSQVGGVPGVAWVILVALVAWDALMAVGRSLLQRAPARPWASDRRGRRLTSCRRGVVVEGGGGCAVGVLCGGSERP